MDLSIPIFIVSIVAAATWFHSASTISREKELVRRRKQADESGLTPDLSGLVILDGETKYDLIATLRHQAQWSRYAAGFTAIALLLQATDKIV